MNTRQLLKCEHLRARVSARQCFINRIKALTLRESSRSLGRLWPCLNCEKGKRIQVFLPPEDPGISSEKDPLQGIGPVP